MQQNDGTAGAAFTLCGGCGGALVGLTAACVSIRSEGTRISLVLTVHPHCCRWDGKSSLDGSAGMSSLKGGPRILVSQLSTFRLCTAQTARNVTDSPNRHKALTLQALGTRMLGAQPTGAWRATSASGISTFPNRAHAGLSYVTRPCIQQSYQLSGLGGGPSTAKHPHLADLLYSLVTSGCTALGIIMPVSVRPAAPNFRVSACPAWSCPPAPRTGLTTRANLTNGMEGAKPQQPDRVHLAMPGHHPCRRSVAARVKPGETPEQALERRKRESAQVEERVIYITDTREWEREVARVRGRQHWRS